MAHETILLIDDDDEDQEIFVMALNQISPDIECICLSDAKRALAQLQNGSLKPGIIFLDLNMPMMNGQQLLLNIKDNAVLSTVPVVVFSTSSDPHTMRNVMEMGAYEFITKPASFDGLVDLLKPLIS